MDEIGIPRWVFSGIVGGLTTIVVIWLINRPAKDGSVRTQLRTGPIMFWFVAVFSPMLLLLAIVGGWIIAFGTDGEAPNPLFGIGLGLFLGLISIGGMWQAIDSRTRFAEWDDHWLTVSRPKGKMERYARSDVVKLSYVFWMQAHKIHFSDGTDFTFFETMTGAKELIAWVAATVEDTGIAA